MALTLFQSGRITCRVSPFFLNVLVACWCVCVLCPVLLSLHPATSPWSHISQHHNLKRDVAMFVDIERLCVSKKGAVYVNMAYRYAHWTVRSVRYGRLKVLHMFILVIAMPDFFLWLCNIMCWFACLGQRMLSGYFKLLKAAISGWIASNQFSRTEQAQLSRALILSCK